MSPAEANAAIASENEQAERGAKWSLFPPGFTYRPPIEQVCGCGKKHTGPFQNCPTCRAYNADRSNFK